MKTTRELVISLIQEKIDLYKELVDILDAEAQAIKSMQVDDLWRFSGEKQVAIRAIEGIRGQLLSALTEMGIRHEMGLEHFSLNRLLDQLPEAILMPLNGRQAQLFLLKDQVKGQAEQNRQFVETYLTVINDMIGIITAPVKDTGLYGQNRAVQYDSAVQPRVFHQEV
ncbi:MAG: hypothetical protein CSA22_08995 [Deltaproteobacteria bacterium]|nr:MAG: hypothetical protein CSA22_08995 [Deltaproteobacteria bacterium]